MKLPLLQDERGRVVRYLRFSVTDRCNLRCFYCAPQAGGLKFIPHASILSYEEFLRLARIGAACGIRKIRLTGGEPFVRRGFIDFLRALRREQPGMHLGLTSNGTLLRPHIEELRSLGLNSLNISLDTFNPETYRSITGASGESAPASGPDGAFREVRAALDDAMRAGLNVKVNAVGLKGVNSGELPEFLDFARQRRLDFRIIEYMPLGGRAGWDEGKFWSAGDILAQAGKLARLTPRETEGDAGPARMFGLEGGQGRFGVITPLSEHFCGSCNRLRVSSDGRLRPCLFSDRAYRLRELLRNPKISDQGVYRVLAAACRCKPFGVDLLHGRRDKERVIQGKMQAIGG